MSKSSRPTRVANIETDIRILEKLTEMYSAYIETAEKPITQLGFEFNEFFKTERIISFRVKTPKALNQKGEGTLQEAKLWVM